MLYGCGGDARGGKGGGDTGEGTEGLRDSLNIPHSANSTQLFATGILRGLFNGFDEVRESSRGKLIRKRSDSGGGVLPGGPEFTNSSKLAGLMGVVLRGRSVAQTSGQSR